MAVGILHKSIHTLILDSYYRSEKEQSCPNLVIRMIFSTLNLAINVVNVSCFAQANHLTGYRTNEEKRNNEQQ